MAALTHSAGYILRQALVDLSLGSNPVDQEAWPVYHSKEPSEPDNVITISDTTARDLGRTSPDSERTELYGVQVRVRSADEEAGWAKVRALAVALDQLWGIPVVVDAGLASEGSYTFRHFIRSSGPIPLGEENPSSSRRLFTVNGLVSIKEIE